MNLTFNWRVSDKDARFSGMVAGRTLTAGIAWHQGWYRFAIVCPVNGTLASGMGASFNMCLCMADAALVNLDAEYP